MRFALGVLLGLVATGANFAILYAVVRSLVRRQSAAARYLVPVFQVVRYALFAAIIYLALRFQLGSVLGLLAGVTLGIAGFFALQVVSNAGNRRSG
jgi:hypothetical protein